MPIEVRELSVSLGTRESKHTVLDRITFDIDEGEFVAILGPSGCGKSTLLRVLAGFQQPSAGGFTKDGTVSPGPGLDRAMVMQQNALFPWLTVIENIEYPQKIQGASQVDRRDAAMRWLKQIGLVKFADYYPQRISIGMQQKVALARLFNGNASTLLMDEPFGALDTLARVHAQRLLLHIWEHERRTVIFVTHDVEEALLLADRVLVLGGSPTRLIKSHPVRWQRPREFNLLFTPEFVRLRKELLTMIGVMSS